MDLSLPTRRQCTPGDVENMLLQQLKLLVLVPPLVPPLENATPCPTTDIWLRLRLPPRLEPGRRTMAAHVK